LFSATVDAHFDVAVMAEEEAEEAEEDEQTDN
jgi:hypothetical protein